MSISASLSISRSSIGGAVDVDVDSDVVDVKVGIELCCGTLVAESGLDPISILFFIVGIICPVALAEYCNGGYFEKNRMSLLGRNSKLEAAIGAAMLVVVPVQTLRSVAEMDRKGLCTEHSSQCWGCSKCLTNVRFQIHSRSQSCG